MTSSPLQQPSLKRAWRKRGGQRRREQMVFRANLVARKSRVRPFRLLPRLYARERVQSWDGFITNAPGGKPCRQRIGVACAHNGPEADAETAAPHHSPCSPIDPSPSNNGKPRFRQKMHPHRRSSDSALTGKAFWVLGYSSVKEHHFGTLGWLTKEQRKCTS